MPMIRESKRKKGNASAEEKRQVENRKKGKIEEEEYDTERETDMETETADSKEAGRGLEMVIGIWELVKEQQELIKNLQTGREKTDQEVLEMKKEIKEMKEENKRLKEEINALRSSQQRCETGKKETIKEIGKEKKEVTIKETGQEKMEVTESEETEKGTGKKTYADTAGKGKRKEGTSGEQENKEWKRVKTRKSQMRSNVRKTGEENQGREDRLGVIRIRSEEEFKKVIGRIRKIDPGKNGIVVSSVRKDEGGNTILKILGKKEDRVRFRLELDKGMRREDRIERVQKLEYVHTNNLDALTKEKEILVAVCRETEIGREEVRLTSLRPAFGETQKATIRLPRDAAGRIARRARIGIGMVACRANLRGFEPRCYGCGGSGHLAIKCKNREKICKCFRCEGEGHFARECKEKTRKK